ncbi:uridine phosphorylase 2-like isoform X1 [Diadema setosum]|uniref:uridine phosphorylase 2-like isoform X1 n=1 Tax=Diadema setosum TaxID=31175 RepID=UPI003B3BB704
MSAQHVTNRKSDCGLNPHLKKYESDCLFHIGFTTVEDDFQALFGDIKFICMGGTPSRMKRFSEFVAEQLKVEWKDYTRGERYCIFKSGCVLCVNHGIGKPSASVVLHEIIKLVHYAQCKDPVFIRLGTCGGINCEPGTVVITDKALDEMFKPEYNLPVLGRIVTRPTQLSQEVADDIQSCQPSYNNFSIIKANTLCASDFFEGQARLDGALCQYSEEEKMEYIRRARDAGVRNIEMESAVIAGMCNAVNIKAAVVCVTLLDRLKSDQVLLSVDKVHELERRPMEVVIAYIRKKLQSSLIEMRQDHKI